MSETTVGEIGLDVVLNSKEFQKQLVGVRNIASNAGEKICNSFSKVGAVIASAFSIAAIKSFTQACIESAASVKAADSQFTQTFGELESQADSAIKTVSKSSGIVKSRLQGVGTSIYAFAKTAGMDSAQALMMMQEALEVTADSAAYYDRSLEDTAESLKSFLKGNFENDAALGLSCTETTRNTAANKLYGKSFKDLSEAQKQLTLLEMVKDANKLSGALGQASRESDGWENVLGNLKETWNQFLAVVGKPVLSVAVVVIKNITSALSTLTQYVEKAINKLSKFFGWEFEDSESSMSGVAVDAQNISESLENVEQSAEKAKRSLAGFDKLNLLSKSNASSSNNESFTDNLNTISDKVVDTTENQTKGIFSNFYEKSGLKAFFESDFVQGVSSVIVDAYDTVNEETKKWASENEGTISEFVNGNINSFKKFKDAITGIFDDIGNKISQWWFEGGGKEAFTQLYDILLDIGTFFMETWNTHIQPLIDDAIDGIKDWWNGSGSDMFDEMLSCFNSISDCLTVLFENVVKPYWEYCDKEIFPKITPFISMIGDLLYEVFTYLSDSITTGLKKLGGLCDFITGVFSGDLEKAGEGLKKYFTGVAEDTMNTCKFITNSVIDIINGFIGSLWDSYKKMANGLSNFMGKGDVVTGDYQKIPKLSYSEIKPRHFATGGIVKAPTLAVVGDNSGANTGDPEVISPLSKLQGMINTSNGEDLIILTEILEYLKRIYELFVIFKNNGGGGVTEFIAEIDDEVVFRKMVKRNEAWKKRHNGKSAFA